MHFYGIRKWKGHIAITPWRQDASGVWQKGTPEKRTNLVVNTGLDLIASTLETNNIQTQLTHFSLGTSNAVVAATDIQLGAETFRKAISTYTNGISPGVAVSTGYVAPAEANSFTIEEIGWWVGGATITPNSGVLLARVNYTRLKVAGEALQIDRTDTFA